MDCMEAMKQFPDNAFDLAVVDPPYGINADKFNNGSGKKTGGKGDSTATKLRKGRLNTGSGKLKNRLLNQSDCSWDSEPPQKEYFNELFRVSKNQIIWGGTTLTFPRPMVLSSGIRCSRGKTSPRLSWLGLPLTVLLHCLRCAIPCRERYTRLRSLLRCMNGCLRSMPSRVIRYSIRTLDLVPLALRPIMLGCISLAMKSMNCISICKRKDTRSIQHKRIYF